MLLQHPITRIHGPQLIVERFRTAVRRTVVRSALPFSPAGRPSCSESSLFQCSLLLEKLSEETAQDERWDSVTECLQQSGSAVCKSVIFLWEFQGWWTWLNGVEI